MVYNFGWIFLPKFDIFVICCWIWPTFFDIFCDRCYCHFFCWQPFDAVGRCCCQLVVMADVLAIVADVKATLFVCINPQLLNVFVVADVITTLLGWCIYHSGWWNYHIYGLMFYPIIPIGTAMWVTAFWLVWFVADGITTFFLLWLADVIAITSNGCCDWLMLLP